MSKIRQAIELKKNILDDMRANNNVEHLQKVDIVVESSELISQDEIVNCYDSTDFEDVIVASLYDIIKITKYELTDHEKNELLFYANESFEG